jgi:hypothetical protein
MRARNLQPKHLFPQRPSGESTDTAAILIAEFLADQVAAELIAEERARRERA